MMSKNNLGKPADLPAMPVLGKPAAFPKSPTERKPQVFSGASAKTPEAHMAKRKAAGTSVRAIADEFGTSKSTAQRKTAGGAGMMARGFNKLGRAG